MTTWEVLLLFGLLLLAALVATARSALVNVRKPRLRELVDEGVGGAGAVGGIEGSSLLDCDTDRPIRG